MINQKMISDERLKIIEGKVSHAEAISVLLPEDLRGLIIRLRSAEAALKIIASTHRPRHDTEEYWLKINHEQCAVVLVTDTKIARAHFNTVMP